MQENDQILETPIQDEESFRTAVLDFLEGNCERVNESESSLEDGSERVKECRNFQKEFERLQKEREAAFQEFYNDVKSGAFPESKHIIEIKESELEKFLNKLEKK